MAGVVEMLVPMQRVVLLLPAEEQPREVIDRLHELLQGGQGQPEAAEAQPDGPPREEAGGQDEQQPEDVEDQAGVPLQGQADVQPELQAEEPRSAPGTPEAAQGEDAGGAPQAAQPAPLPQRVMGRRGAAREAEHQMRLATQHLSPPRQGGRRMRRT